VTLADYPAEIARSGFPGIRPLDPMLRTDLLDGYLDRVADYDLDESGAGIRDRKALRRWLTAYAAATATATSFATVRNAAAEGSNEPLHRAINHWAGDLAEVALRLAHREYQVAGEGWTGLAGPTKAVMEAMANGCDQSSRHAQAVLASRLSFLFAVDEQWCLDAVLPLVDPDIDLSRAIRCWDGLLMGRIGPPKLLENRLLDLFLAMAQHLGDRRDETGRHYHQRLAEVALFHGINPVEQGWLDRYTTSAAEESRVEWIRQISYALPHLSSGEADAQWDAWMGQYWSNRLASRPRELTDEEATARLLTHLLAHTKRTLSHCQTLEGGAIGIRPYPNGLEAPPRCRGPEAGRAHPAVAPATALFAGRCFGWVWW